MSTTISDTPTDAEIRSVLYRLDAATIDVADSLAASAAKCIRWLQAGQSAAELDVETKQHAIDALTENRGLSDDDLWAAMKLERDQLREANAVLLEACKKASTCASIPDYVMDMIRAAVRKAEGRR